MTRSMLFGYTVEREDGKVIVTIDGAMAGEVMGRLARRRAHFGAGGVPFPFGPLGSPAISLTQLFAAEAAPPPEEEAEPDLGQVFGQGFDRSYDEYDAKLQAYRALMAAHGDHDDTPPDKSFSVEIEPSAGITPRKAATAAPAPAAKTES